MKQYEAPELTIITFAVSDVITTSDNVAPPIDGLIPEDQWSDFS